MRDGRLVIVGEAGIIIYHRYAHQSDIIIKDDGGVETVCELRNGNLVSPSFHNGNIKIYERDEDDYKLIHTLKEHTNRVTKVIELKDGRLCSSSDDKRIIIWDQNYKPIQILTEHIGKVGNIIEINDYIVSASSSSYFDGVKIWNKLTYKCNKTIKDIYCFTPNGISKLKENTLIFGGVNKLFILDVLSFQYHSLKDRRLEGIFSIFVLRKGKVLVGNSRGEIICYDSLSEQIISYQQMHDEKVSSIIETGDNKILSSSWDGSIQLYEHFNLYLTF